MSRPQNCPTKHALDSHSGSVVPKESGFLAAGGYALYSMAPQKAISHTSDDFLL